MGGRPGLCSAIQSSPWQAVCRGCVRVCVCVCASRYCSMYRDNPCLCRFTPSLHNPPPLHNGEMLTLSFAHFPAHSRLRSSVSTETGSGGRELSPTHSGSFSQSNTKLPALHTGPAETAYFHCRLPALCRSFCAAVQWNKKGDCLYLGTMEQLSAAAELTRSDSPAPRKIIVLDHKPLCTDQWNCESEIQMCQNVITLEEAMSQEGSIITLNIALTSYGMKKKINIPPNYGPLCFIQDTQLIIICILLI